MTFWKKIQEIIFSNRDLSLMGIVNVGTTIISALFWLYIAAIVDVDEYGEISFLIAIASITATIASLGALNTLIIYTAKKIKIQSSIFFIALVSSVIASTIVFFIFSSFATSLYVVGYVIFNLITSEIIGRKLYGTFSKFVFIQRVLSIIISLALYFIMGTDGIVLGIALSFFIYSRKLFVILKQTKISVSSLKPYRGFMINNYAYDISKSLVIYLDKLIILPLFGLATLGQYHLAFQFLAIGIILPGTVFQYIVPQEASGILNKKLKMMGILLSVGIAGLTIICVPTFLTMFFPQYTDSILMIQIMILSAIPYTVNLKYISKFLANENNGPIVIGALIFIVVQILGLFTLGKLFDIVGIATSLVLAHTAESIYLFLADKRIKWIEK